MGAYLFRRRKAWGIEVFPEQRHFIRNGRYMPSNIWVIDPETFEAETHTADGSSKVDNGILHVPGTPIEVPLEALDRD